LEDIVPLPGNLVEIGSAAGGVRFGQLQVQSHCIVTVSKLKTYRRECLSYLVIGGPSK